MVEYKHFRSSDGYPQLSFTTGSETGFPGELIISDKHFLPRFEILIKERLLHGDCQESVDYVFRPHLYIPRLKLWVSDGHRFLVPMVLLSKQLGVSPKRILSVDLDYFARIDKSRLDEEVANLISAVCSINEERCVVIADMHEDIPRVETVCTQKDYASAVRALNERKVLDENFISALEEKRIIIVKPPLVEFTGTLRETDSMTVCTRNMLVDGQDDHVIESFDMIHVCTSPTYIDPGKAFYCLSLFVKLLTQSISCHI